MKGVSRKLILALMALFLATAPQIKAQGLDYSNYLATASRIKVQGVGDSTEKQKRKWELGAGGRYPDAFAGKVYNWAPLIVAQIGYSTESEPDISYAKPDTSCTPPDSSYAKPDPSSRSFNIQTFLWGAYDLGEKTLTELDFILKGYGNVSDSTVVGLEMLILDVDPLEKDPNLKSEKHRYFFYLIFVRSQFSNGIGITGSVNPKNLIVDKKFCYGLRLGYTIKNLFDVNGLDCRLKTKLSKSADWGMDGDIEATFGKGPAYVTLRLMKREKEPAVALVEGGVRLY